MRRPGDRGMIGEKTPAAGERGRQNGMMEFLEKYLYWFLAAFILFVFLYQGGKALRSRRRDPSEEKEAEAEVIRVQDRWNMRTGDLVYRKIYAEYTDLKGRRREGRVTLNSKEEYKKGDRLRIRYFPGDWDAVRIVGRAKKQ